MRFLRAPRPFALAFLALSLLGGRLQGEDGYRLWLRYDPLADDSLRAADLAQINEISGPTASPTLAAARDELCSGLTGLLGKPIPVTEKVSAPHALVFGTPASNPDIASFSHDQALAGCGDEGFVLRTVQAQGRSRIVIAANRDIGVLYGAFELLRRVQTGQALDRLDVVSVPKISRRLLNHWDNLNGTVERGYAGNSLWDWFNLPDYVSPRYRDYARANASIGINGAVLNNVNSDILILNPDYLRKIAALADVFRPYGIKVYLCPRFSAPLEFGDLKTADPLDPAVRIWWQRKIDEIYRFVPDFGGFLVKANSEGQPGPQDYQRSHADGANMLASALAPHGGIVMWRAFVYDHKIPDDRSKQSFNEFKPLDGAFLPNVAVQAKNGPIDFMPREPFHPLFGAMPKTSLALEVQITQEYLGGSVHLVYLAPLFKECLESDTYARGPGSTVARVVDGSVFHQPLSIIAGVANIGNVRNWTGHPLGAANWYAFGRLAWDHSLSSANLADEWVRMSFSNDARIREPMTKMLLESREAAVNYMMPLGLHHIMAVHHHYGPGPWNDQGRPDWTSVYYHRASGDGIGFERTAKGSNALSQYAPPVRAVWEDLAKCPDEYVLWFHHVPWDYRTHSGQTVWDDLALHYQKGVDTVRQWKKTWATLHGQIDEERFEHVQALLSRQEREARVWRDACLLYFQTFSQRPLPAGVEAQTESLEYYKKLRLHWVPGVNSDKDD